MQAVNYTFTTDSGEIKNLTWDSICIKVSDKCQFGESLLTFEQNSDLEIEPNLTDA